MLAAAVMLLSACAEGGSEEASFISIQKDGTVLSHIVEEFGQSYYDEEGLQQAILQEAADYNKSTGETRVSVEKIDVNDGVATVRMAYQDAGDYAGFDRVIFFVGDAAQAEDQYELNVVLSGVRDRNDTVGRADILAMKDYRLLIMDVQEPVRLNGRAEYVSDNVTASNDRKSVQLSGDGLGYVLYK